MFTSYPISHYFPHFPYATGALLAAALVPKLRVCGFVYILGLYRSFKQTLLRDLQFLLSSQLLLVFIARTYEALFPGNGSLGCAVWLGAEIADSPGVPPGFDLANMNVGPPVPLVTTTAAAHHCCLTVATPHPLRCGSPSLPPILSGIVRDVSYISLNPWLLDFIQFNFLEVLVVFCVEVSRDRSYGCARRQSVSTYTSILAGTY